MDPGKSTELKNAHVVLDRLIYQRDDANLPSDRPHAFIYFLTIRNLSDRRFTLLGRKWILQQADGSTQVIEGDKIVGQTPTLAPGEEFSYNSYHVTAVNTVARGSFHGLDEFNQPIHVKIPPFNLIIPVPPPAAPDDSGRPCN
ncbi:MAG: ApaG domain [Opitutales bacterium]